MNRKIEREVRLPAFSCDLPALQALIATAKGLFLGDEVLESITVELPGEILEFQSTEELQTHVEHLPPRVSELQVFVVGSGDPLQSVRLSTNKEEIHCRVAGPNPAWCAGMTETIRDFAQRNRVWYASLRSFQVWILVSLLALVPLALRQTTGASLETGYGVYTS
jgi:hypothetical protein